MRQALPIDPFVPHIQDQVRQHRVVVVRAEPGSGKTTRLPPSLVVVGEHGRVVVVEPRRIAAVAAATRVATETATEVGEQVGYRVRHERRGSAQTPLWYVTDGILLRDLLHDPFLEGVAILVFDEFHERRVATDTLFAIARFLQQNLRPDLRIVLLSATLDPGLFPDGSEDVAIVDCPGTGFPVRTFYTGRSAQSLTQRLLSGLELAFSQPEHTGDTLVFLPGVGEIAVAKARLRAWAENRGVELCSLHGGQSLEEQRRVFEPGGRRVILSTNVAESSITVPRVTAVVDSGLAREAYFDRARGLNTLRLMAISRASAEQRKGRAGRTAPGLCVRLGAPAEYAARRPYSAPEVVRVDLADVLLQVLAWGVEAPERLPWLDSPPASAVQAGYALLEKLGAIDRQRRVSELGRQLARLPLDVRLGRWLLAAQEFDCAEDTALLAALWSEGARMFAEVDGSMGGELAPCSHGSDLLRWAERYCAAAEQEFQRDTLGRLHLSLLAVQRIERARGEFARLLGLRHSRPRLPDPRSPALATLLLAYPDRLCRTRPGEVLRGTMVGGSGVALSPTSAARGAAWFLALEVQWPTSGKRREAQVRTASGVEYEWIQRLLPEAIHSENRFRFDATAQRVVREEQECVFDLVVRSVSHPASPSPEAGRVLFEALREDPERALSLSPRDRELVLRLAYVAKSGVEGFADFAEPRAVWLEVLRQLSERVTSAADLARMDAGKALRERLGTHALRVLDREAPAEMRLPSGRVARIDYSEGRPTLAVRIQEVFGWSTTPTIGSRQVPVTLRLLAPSGRPVQITTDLGSFWRTGYPEVRRQLRARYPKHAWPENP